MNVRWSANGRYHTKGYVGSQVRFILTRRTFGWNLLDMKTKEIIRMFTKQGAMAVAETRVGGEVVHHEGKLSL